MRNYFNTAIEPRRPQLEDPPPRRELLPCTEEFIANGGDYERLPSKATEGDAHGQ